MARAGSSLLMKNLTSALRGSAYGAPHQAWSFLCYRGMSTRLFVGGLAFSTEEEGLRTAFSKFGEVIDCRIVTDRESGSSRGFGFVTFLKEEEAQTAMDKMDKQFLDGRIIRVNPATPRPAPPPRPSNISMAQTEQQQQQDSGPQDWGPLPTPIACVPQNAGLASPSSASFDSPASQLPDLSSLASPGNAFTANSGLSNMPSSSNTGFNDISAPTKASTKDTGPSFDFIDLDLSNLPPPDPNRLPRRRPPRIRPSMMEDSFGYYMSETSKFPFNTRFETGFPLRMKTPEFEFDFTDIKEALAAKKAEELAAKQAKEAEEMALKAKEAAEQENQEETNTSAFGVSTLNDATAETMQSESLESATAQVNVNGESASSIQPQDAASAQTSMEVQSTEGTSSSSQVQHAAYGS